MSQQTRGALENPDIIYIMMIDENCSSGTVPVWFASQGAMFL